MHNRLFLLLVVWYLPVPIDPFGWKISCWAAGLTLAVMQTAALVGLIGFIVDDKSSGLVLFLYAGAVVALIAAAGMRKLQRIAPDAVAGVG